MKGFYFEEFEIGQALEVAQRTVTEADVVLFTGVTGMFNPLFLNADFAAKSNYQQRIVPGILTLGMAIGITEWMIHGTVVALLGVDKVRFMKPLYFGDTIEVHTIPVRKRDSQSYPVAGIVHFENRVVKTSNGDTVLTFERDILIHKGAR
jgi:3-hydroxybutyryl-CoA dehydratase